MRRLVLLVLVAFLATGVWAGDPDLDLQRRLLARGVTSDVGSLITALSSAEASEVRSMAAQYLSMRPDPAAWKSLVDAAEKDPDEMVRAQAVNAMLAVDCGRAETIAAAALDRCGLDAAKEVLASAMSRCGQPEGLKLYLEMLNRRDDKLGRYRAVIGCGWFLLTGSDETRDLALDCLLRGFSDAEPSVRAAAQRSLVLAVGTYGVDHPAAVERLHEISQNSPSEADRAAAAEALRSLRVKRQSSGTEEH